ncbi:MAG: vanadium-dependent haloperoxidase [Actinomycetota bacterium]
MSVRSAPDPGTRARIVLRWNNAILDGVRESKMGPPIVARALAVAHTCMFDAWAAYDRRAVGTRLGGSLRRPRNERTPANRAEAVSYAAYRAATDLFPASMETSFDALMENLGYDPNDTTTDRASPAGIGNLACRAVLDLRHHDGSNQLGDEPGGASGAAYSDYTGYAPVNDPMELLGAFNAATVVDASRWQPLSYMDATGAPATQRFLTPFWDRVIPFALSSASQFRSSTGPAVAGTRRYVKQAAALLRVSAELTDRRKMISEYWTDGPSSETPPGHWNLLVQYVSHRDGHNLSQDVKMYFTLNNALLDAGITAWDNKIHFDSVRPITAIRYLFRNRRVLAWGGPYQGTQLIHGRDWLPYEPSTFPTPPFAEYSSGHSTFSAAAAEVLQLFTGSNRFGASVVLPAGSSRIEPGAVPARDVTLVWATFGRAAAQAGRSRRYGGIHFRQADLEARIAGHKIGRQAWRKAREYITGAAS